MQRYKKFLILLRFPIKTGVILLRFPIETGVILLRFPIKTLRISRGRKTLFTPV